MKQHLSEEQLQGYVTGQLRALEAAQVELHLGECAKCREVLALQRELNTLLEEWEAPDLSANFDARLQEQLQERETRPQRGSGWYGRWGWFAAAAALVFALWFSWQKAPQGDPLPIERVEETLADLEALAVLEGEESEAL